MQEKTIQELQDLIGQLNEAIPMGGSEWNITLHADGSGEIFTPMSGLILPLTAFNSIGDLFRLADALIQEKRGTVSGLIEVCNIVDNGSESSYNAWSEARHD